MKPPQQDATLITMSSEIVRMTVNRPSQTLQVMSEIVQNTISNQTNRGGPHMRSLISIYFPAPEMEPESAHVVSAVSVP